MQNYFGPTLVAIVEVFIRAGSLSERQFVRDDERWISLVVMNQIAEPAVIGLNIALAGTHLLALEPKFTEVEGYLTFFRERGPSHQDPAV